METSSIEHICKVCKRAPRVLGKVRCVACCRKVRLAIRKKREALTKNGVCSRCGKNKPKKNTRICRSCTKKLIVKFNVLVRERRKVGICYRCGVNKTSVGKATCEPCLISRRAYRASKKRGNLLRGTCRLCKRKRWGKRRYCQKHVLALRRRYQRNPSKHKQQSKEVNERLRAAVFEGYGGAWCRCCGEENPRLLSLDHIKNNGKAHRERLGVHSYKLYRWAIKHNFPKSLQVLCLGCNIGKAFNGGVCPHESENEDRKSSMP